MVVLGLTVTGIPLVTARLPGLMTAVPLVKMAVRLLLDPSVMVAGLATNVVITGAGYAITVANCLTIVPLELVTVRV